MEMENNPENNPTSTPAAMDHYKKIPEQQQVVAKLEERIGKEPSDALSLELDREKDRLRFYTNASKGNPKRRAKEAAEDARDTALSRAFPIDREL